MSMLDVLLQRTQERREVKEKTEFAMRTELAEHFIRCARGESTGRIEEERCADIAEALDMNDDAILALSNGCAEWVREVDRIATLMQEGDSLSRARSSLEEADKVLKAAQKVYNEAMAKVNRLNDLRDILGRENVWRERFTRKFPEIAAAENA